MRQTTHFSGCRGFLHRTIAAALGALAIAAAQAEDIDIFAGGTGTTTKPNVLVILDSSSNWNSTLGTNPCNAKLTKFGAEVCALSTVAGVLTDKIRFGLMLFAEQPGNSGGYVRFAVRDMTAQNKAAFASLVNNFVDNGSGTDNSGSTQPYGKAMYEAFKYFGGYTSPAHC